MRPSRRAPPPPPERAAKALERTGPPSAPSTAAACLNTPRAKALERTGLPPARSTAAGRRGAFTAACRGGRNLEITISNYFPLRSATEVLFERAADGWLHQHAAGRQALRFAAANLDDDFQKKELDRRLDDLKKNPTEGQPWEEVRAEIQNRL